MTRRSTKSSRRSRKRSATMWNDGEILRTDSEYSAEGKVGGGEVPTDGGERETESFDGVNGDGISERQRRG